MHEVEREVLRDSAVCIPFTELC